MGENRRGFHHPNAVNMEKGGSGQGRMEPPAQGRAGMKEPTNHAGHTYDKARGAEHNRNVERMRGAHAAHHGYRDHEQILHETHKLHNGDFTSHGNKHGASSYLRRDEERGERGGGRREEERE